MNKEIVAGIGKAIEEAQRTKDLREQQETARREAGKLRQEAEKRALIAKNEARLRATGVVELFEEIVNSNALGKQNASLFWNSNHTEILIKFDAYCNRTSDGDGGFSFDEGGNFLSAKIARITGKLKIGNHVLGRKEKLEDAVRDEILRLKGLKE